MKIDKKRNINTDNGNRNPESGRGRRSKASQVVIQRNPGHVGNKRNPTRIGTWNVRTLLSPGRLEELKQQMREKELDVLGVCETRWGDNDDFWIDDFRIIHSRGKQGKNGVALLLNKNYGTCIENTYHINDRILMVRIKTASVNSTIIQVYFPTSNSDEEEIEQIYNILEELIERIHHKDNLIITEDFNAVVGNVADSDVIGKYGLGTRNERGSRLVNFCKQNSFVITNIFFEVPLRRRYTWTAPGDTARYQLDYILVKYRYKN
uniref:Craniofacial development protein 2 n=1 Tax=Schizaphis graminum TaxID=13262 RepID=A0A2S2PFK6_SCHGA